MVPQTRWLLLVCGLTLALLAAYATSGDEQSESDTKGRVKTASVQDAQQTIPEDAPRTLSSLPLDKLHRQVHASGGADLFATYSWVPLPPPPVSMPTDPTPAPTAPALPFTYLGRFQEESGKVTVYLAQGERPHSVNVGDTIDGIYRVEEIEADSVTFVYLPLNTKQTLNIIPHQ